MSNAYSVIVNQVQVRCNDMILRLADHDLYVIQSRLNLIFFATAMSSSSYRLIVAMTLSLSYRLGSISALAFSGTEVHALLVSQSSLL